MQGPEENRARPYLETYFNKRLQIEPTQTPAQLSQYEIARIQTQATRILVAMDVPRRLGADATSAELADDKRRCRRVLHVLRQQMLSWAEQDESRIQQRPIDEEDRREGSTLLWKTWWKDHKKYLEQRRAYLATWGLKTGEKTYANKSVNRLDQELKQMEHAMR